MDTTATTTIPTEFAARVDTYDDPVDLVVLLALRAFLSGAQPMARTVGLQRVRAEATLIPPGLAPVRQAVTKNTTALMAEGPGWTLVARRYSDRTAIVMVVAVTDELAADVLAMATADAEDPAEKEPDSVDIGFWHMGRHGPRRVERTITAPVWDDIARNYERRAGGAVAQLIARTEAPAAGRLLLLHGPPGTGKTTLIRALAGAWRSWCRVDHVMDPEALWGRSGYLLDVMADDHDDSRWRLLVLEDCDELIRAEAKAGAGQALARLLNVTDGLIGQGTRVLVCITTNERLGRLHPAITRPGRCLAEVEVGPLPAVDARAWLGAPLPDGRHEATLAELFGWRDGQSPITATEPDVAVGTYL